MRTPYFGIVAIGLALTCFSPAVPARPAIVTPATAAGAHVRPTIPAAVAAARDLGGIDPRRALDSLRQLRQAALTRGESAESSVLSADRL